ncbi:hypothetical protein L1887_53994 [Cichorium endivia]|nr:hypothetical protein L1887_53994 [Cichorium endivia]
MATSLPTLRETSPAKLHRLPWCCERLCTRSSSLRHFSSHGWACEASGERCPRSEPFWRPKCFSLSPYRLCDGESSLSEHARPHPLLARWPHGLPFFSATFVLRCSVQLAEDSQDCSERLLPKNTTKKRDHKLSRSRSNTIGWHCISRSRHSSHPLPGVAPVIRRPKQHHGTDRRALAKHHTHEEAYRLTRPGRHAYAGKKGEKLVYKAAAQCETAKQRVKDQAPSLAHSATSASEA